MKRYEGASVRPAALMLSPEAPFPPVGGGALRTSSLINYLARRFNIDIITFRESPTDVRTFPADRVRSTLVLDLPVHSRSPAARAGRNLRRFLLGTPPLLDRYSGFQRPIEAWLEDRVYGLIVIEHFWCAPYAAILRDHAEHLALDLHNVESALQETTARGERWPVSAMFRRFASAYRELEIEWLPKFEDVLAASEEDAARIRSLAPGTRVIVYPNTLPTIEQPAVPEEDAVIFSGNLEYHPNVAAMRWFGEAIWTQIQAHHPQVEWRIAGKNPQAVPVAGPGIKVLGPVDDAVRTLAAAKVAVVPMLAGSGTRFKILEAWAAGRAVVSTTLGAEGLGAVDNEHILIADTADSFAQAVNVLLNDAGLRGRLGANGRKLYLDRFTNEAGWRGLESAAF